MDKMIEYICDEMETLERKVDKGGKLTMAEVQYADTLAHLKKNILTADAMMESEEGGSYEGGSYARGRGRYAKRDSMGRYSREGGSYDDGSYEGSYGRTYDRGGRDYSREDGYSREGAKEDLIAELHKMERNARDEESKRMVKKWIKQAEEQ